MLHSNHWSKLTVGIIIAGWGGRSCHMRNRDLCRQLRLVKNRSQQLGLQTFPNCTIFCRLTSKVCRSGCYGGTPFLSACSVLGDLPCKLYAAVQVGFAKSEWLLDDFGSRGYSCGGFDP